MFSFSGPSRTSGSNWIPWTKGPTCKFRSIWQNSILHFFVSIFKHIFHFCSPLRVHQGKMDCQGILGRGVKRSVLHSIRHWLLMLDALTSLRSLLIPQHRYPYCSFGWFFSFYRASKARQDPLVLRVWWALRSVTYI